jgi:molecular chaperone DnaK
MSHTSSSASPCRIRKTVGIDLGTTNSVIAVLDATDSTLLTGQDEHGRRTFPSLVGSHPEHGRLVAGRAAQTLLPAIGHRLSAIGRRRG